MNTVENIFLFSYLAAVLSLACCATTTLIFNVNTVTSVVLTIIYGLACQSESGTLVRNDILSICYGKKSARDASLKNVLTVSAVVSLLGIATLLTLEVFRVLHLVSLILFAPQNMAINAFFKLRAFSTQSIMFLSNNTSEMVAAFTMYFVFSGMLFIGSILVVEDCSRRMQQEQNKNEKEEDEKVGEEKGGEEEEESNDDDDADDEEKKQPDLPDFPNFEPAEILLTTTAPLSEPLLPTSFLNEKKQN